MFTSGATTESVLDIEAIRLKAEREGYFTFVLPEVGIVDRPSFFEAIRNTLPLDPPVVSSRSWEALGDSLWEGLHSHPAQRIVILWPNSEAMIDSTDREMALSVLADVAKLLEDHQATKGRPKYVAILVGNARSAQSGVG
jgi:hypothetical protein